MSRYEIEVAINAQNKASREFKELERDISRVKSESQGATQTTGQFGGALNSLRGAAMGAVAAFGAMEIARVGLEMAQAGEQVVNTANRFRDLTGGATQAAAALDTLRKVSRGMVTDTELMAGASRLLQMGIAGSVDEAAQLVEIAIALKQPTDSAGDAISNLALMIANLSYERLDALGLSAGYVRQRVNELKEAGMDMQEAFAQAVIEQAADSMDRLADSTEQAETNISKLTVKLGNLRDVANQAAFSIAEVAAGAAQFDVSGLLVAGIMEISGANQRLAEEEFDRYLEELRDYIQSSEDALIIRTQDFRQAEAAAERRNTQEITEARQARNSTLTALESDLENERLQIFLRGRERMAFYEQSYLEQGLRQTEAASAYREQIAERETRAIGNTLNMLSDDFDAVFERGELEFGRYDPSNLMAVNAAVQNAQQAFQYAEQQFERGFIDESALNRARQFADYTQEMASSARAGAAAYMDLSQVNLSTLFQTGPGGAPMEMARMVAGMLPEDIGAELVSAMALSTGEETAISREFDANWGPLLARITEELGVEAGQAAAMGLASALLRGIDEELSPEQIVNAINNELPVGVQEVDPIQITIPYGIGFQELERQTGFSIDELIAGLPQEAIIPRPGMDWLRAGEFQFQPPPQIQPTLPPFAQLGYGMGATALPEGESPLQQAATALSDMHVDIQGVNAISQETTFQPMQQGMQFVADATEDAYTNLQTLVDTDWVATVALDFVILDGTKWAQLPGFVNAVQSIMESSTRDNGGVPVGTNQVNGR